MMEQPALTRPPLDVESAERCLREARAGGQAALKRGWEGLGGRTAARGCWGGGGPASSAPALASLPYAQEREGTS